MSAYSLRIIGGVEKPPRKRGAMRPQPEPHSEPRAGHVARRERSAAELDWAAARLAGRQHGMVARWQLLELGFSRDMVKRRVARGVLHRFHQGVYAYGHRAITM